MRLLNRIRQYFYKRMLANQPRPIKRPLVNWQTIRTIGILFDATDLKQTQQVLRYQRKLQQEGKQVRLLAFINGRSKDIEVGYPFFSRGDIDWKLIPTGQAVEDFLTTALDLLLVLSPISTMQFEYISMLTDARLKVGPDSSQRNSYDLMLDVPNDCTPDQMIQLIEKYLKIVLPANKVAKTKQLVNA